jgi:signal-transduction protein with cAMP-binding, CBS, and nucleotidyltransferase domain
MYTFLTGTPQTEVFLKKARELVAQIQVGIPVKRQNVRLKSNTPLYTGDTDRTHIYILREGTLSYSREGRQLFVFEEGDIVGIEGHFVPTDVELLSDFAVILDEYDATTFFEAIHTCTNRCSLWDELLVTQLAISNSLLVGMGLCEISLVPEIRSYQNGDSIIQQGSVGDEIFTLVEGEADVLVDGNKVGTIVEDEIFGALGVLTNSPRTASVVATKDTMVIVLKQEQFVELVQSRPKTILKMVEDMAATIISLNGKMASLSKEQEAGKII